MRFLGAFGLAALIVLAMLLIGLRLAGFVDDEEPASLPLYEVDILTETERGEIAELLGEGGDPAPPSLPLITDIPPLRIESETHDETLTR